MTEYKNFEPSEEDIRWQRANWNSLRVGGMWVTSYGGFQKTEKGYKMTATFGVPHAIMKDFLFRLREVCNECGYELDTSIYDEIRSQINN